MSFLEQFDGMPERSDRYQAGAEILGRTGQDLGLAIDEAEIQRWGEFTRRLAGLDDTFELHPDSMSADGIIEVLELDENPDLRITIDGLLVASKQAMTADTVREHLDAREVEGVHSFGFLLHSTQGYNDLDPSITHQLERLTVAGTYLDTFHDAPEDRHKLPQLSTSKLMAMSLSRSVAEMGRLERRTQVAFARNFSRTGFLSHLVVKELSIPKRFFAKES